MSSVTEGNLGLNYGWAYGESGWNTGMDDNLVKLGFTSRNQVKGILSVPPSTPSNGDAYIVGTSPTGLFSGNFGKVAIWDRTVWLFLTPKNHEVVYNVANGCDYKYDNGWVLKQEDELSPYVKVKDFTFSTGYTITDQKQCLLNLADNKYYQWFGALPKVVPAGSTPETTGGIGAGAWVDRTDVTLRSELAEETSSVLIAGQEAKNVAYDPYVITGRANIRNPRWGAPVDNAGDIAAASANSAAINLMLASSNNRFELDDIPRYIDDTLLIQKSCELHGNGRHNISLIWCGDDHPIIARAGYFDQSAAGFNNVRLHNLGILDRYVDRINNWAIDLTNGNSCGLFDCYLGSELGVTPTSKNGVALGTAVGGTYAGMTWVSALHNFRCVNSKVRINTTDWSITGDSQLWANGRDRALEISGSGAIAPGLQIAPGSECGIFLFNTLGYDIDILNIDGVYFDGAGAVNGDCIKSAAGIGIVQSNITNCRFWKVNGKGIYVDHAYNCNIVDNVFEDCDGNDTGDVDIHFNEVFGCKIDNIHNRNKIAPKTGATRVNIAAPVQLTGRVGFPLNYLRGITSYEDYYLDASVANKDRFYEIEGTLRFALQKDSLPSVSTYKHKRTVYQNTEWYSDGTYWHQSSLNRVIAPASGNLNSYSTTSLKYFIVDITSWTNLPGGATGSWALDVEFISSNYAIQRLTRPSTGQVYTRLYSGSWGAWASNT